MSERREGKSRLVYNKETRIIDTVRTPPPGDMVLVPRVAVVFAAAELKRQADKSCEESHDNFRATQLILEAMLAASPLPTQEAARVARAVEAAEAERRALPAQEAAELDEALQKMWEDSQTYVRSDE